MVRPTVVSERDRQTARHVVTSPGNWVEINGSEQANLIEAVAHALAAERERTVLTFIRRGNK